MSTYHGSCLCKKTKFTLHGEPLQYTVCHCKNCKKASGSAFLLHAAFNISQFTVTQGEDLITHYADSNTLSGRTLTRSFCSKCGSSLFLKPVAREDFVLVHPGQIEEPLPWVPTKESHPDEKWTWLKEMTIQHKEAKI